MTSCKGCGELLPIGHVALYDILDPDADLADPAALGPYCADCFAGTVTGVQVALDAEVDR